MVCRPGLASPGSKMPLLLMPGPVNVPVPFFAHEGARQLHVHYIINGLVKAVHAADLHIDIFHFHFERLYQHLAVGELNVILYVFQADGFQLFYVERGCQLVNRRKFF